MSTDWDPAERPGDDLLVRPAGPEDVDEVAAMFTAARAAAVPAMPPPVHDAAEDRAWLAGWLGGGHGPEAEAWVAEQDGTPVGLLLLEGDWLHSLYVRPGHTGAGVGTLLLELARSRRPHGLELWVFETNTGARRLYERHGFEVLERTDGSHNDEGAPDLRMAWLPSGPAGLAALRRRIDAVDDRLAGLLDERARLTALVQRRKDVPGHAGRDRAREAEIAARMASRATHLDERALAEVMDTVIRVSLDAADRD